MYRKRFIVLLSFLIIAIIGSGYGVFVFERGNSSSSVDAKYNLDDIRDNYIFKDGDDNEGLTLQRYNVYFFAQSDFDPIKKDSDGNPILGDYNYCYDPDNNGGDIYLGYFGDKPVDKEESYYKVLKNVSEISVDELFHVVGEPTTDCTDDTPKNGSEIYGWPLYFNGWALEHDVGNYTGIRYLHHADGTYNIRVYGNFPHPGGGNSVRIMRFGTTIASYLNTLPTTVRESLVHENGTSVPDIFLFPIYTSGKDYVNRYNPPKQNNPIRVRFGEANNTEQAKDVFMNRGQIINDLFADYNNKLIENGGADAGVDNIKAVYHKYAIDINGCKSLTFNFADCRNQWIDWYPIGKYNDTLNPYDEFASRDFLKDDIELEKNGVKKDRTHLSRNGEGAGIYAMYAFRKEIANFEGDNLFVDDDLLKINDFCDNVMGMDRFYCFTTNKFNEVWYNDVHCVQQIYIVIERFFEPRLLGGPTGSYDYNSQACKDYSFLRTQNDTSLFVLRNVKLTADTDMDWHNYKDHQISSAIFSVKLEGVSGHITTKVIGDEKPVDAFAGTGITNITSYNIANYFKPVDANTDLTDYVKSSRTAIKTANDINNDLKEDVLDSFVVNPKVENPKENTLEKNLGFGIYNIALKVNYLPKYEKADQREFGPYIPNHVDLYLRRVTNIYTLIYDGVVPEEEKLSNGFVKPNLEEKDGKKINYAFIAAGVFLDTNLEGTDLFTASDNFVSSASAEYKEAFKEVTGEDLTAKKNYALVDIVTAYDMIGKEVYDRVTEFILNRHTIKDTKFRIEKNYIFQVRNKTTAIN